MAQYNFEDLEEKYPPTTEQEPAITTQGYEFFDDEYDRLRRTHHKRQIEMMIQQRKVDMFTNLSMKQGSAKKKQMYRDIIDHVNPKFDHRSSTKAYKEAWLEYLRQDEENKQIDRDIEYESELIRSDKFDTDTATLLEFVAAKIPKSTIKVRGPRTIQNLLLHIIPAQEDPRIFGINYRKKFHYFNRTTYEELKQEVMSGHDSWIDDSSFELVRIFHFADEIDLFVTSGIRTTGKGKARKTGSFFRHFHKLPGLDLSRYGIFSKEQIEKIKNKPEFEPKAVGFYNPEYEKTILYEYPDFAKLECIIANSDYFQSQITRRTPKERQESFDRLVPYSKLLKKNKGRITYSCRNGSGGRKVAENCEALQNLMREIRQTITKDLYIDLDQKNSHPTIYRYLCGKFGLPTKRIGEYIEKREEIIAEIMAVNPSMTRDDTKADILSAINGRGFEFFTTKKKTEWFVDFFIETSENCKTICHQPEYAHILARRAAIWKVKIAKAKANGIDLFDNTNGSTINCIMCRFESTTLAVMVQFYQEKGLAGTDISLQFDGFQMYCPTDEMKQKIRDAIPECENRIFDRTGIPMKLDIKEPTDAFDLSAFDLSQYDISEYPSRENCPKLELFNTDGSPIDFNLQLNPYTGAHPLDHCLIRALRAGGIPESYLRLVKNAQNMKHNEAIPTCKLTMVANICRCVLKVSYWNEKASKFTHHFYPTQKPFPKAVKVEGSRDKKLISADGLPVIQLAIVDKHYLIADCNTGISKVALENWEELSSFRDDWHQVRTIKRRKDGSILRTEKSFDRDLRSYQVVHWLVNNKATTLEPILLEDRVMDTPYHNYAKEFGCLPTPVEDIHYRLFKPKVLPNKKKDENGNYIATPPFVSTDEKRTYNVVFFDFETTTDGDKHEPFLCHFRGPNYPARSFGGTDLKGQSKCGLYALHTLTEDTLLIAHNARYDSHFLFKYLRNVRLLEKDSLLIALSATFYNVFLKKSVKITIHDSYKVIPAPLRDFGRMFGLTQEKEVMPYGLYNKTRVQWSEARISTAMTYLKNDMEREQMLYNIRRWNLQTSVDSFDHLKYAQKYCEMDVEVLEKGYMQMSEDIEKVTGWKIIDYVSLSAVSDAYNGSVGVYDGVYEFDGVLRQFIQADCLVGGCTRLAHNKPYKTKVGKKVVDFDAVSLYPSAMYKHPGYLMGKPKLFHGPAFSHPHAPVARVMTYKDLTESTDGYFVRIRIKSVGIKRAFASLTSLAEQEKTSAFGNTAKYTTRCFTNDMVGKVVSMDRFALEDAIKYHKITFEILEGYYFDEGRNTKINEAIKRLFDLRFKFKLEKNPIQNAIKALMNLSYGITCLKPCEEDVFVADNADAADRYINANFYRMKTSVQVYDSNQVVITSRRGISNHWTRPHVGVEILSLSKRNMNEVMYLAEDNGIEIMYQDTDSMHLYEEDIPRLEQLYAEKFGRKLIGNNMGQFNSDFDDTIKCLTKEKFDHKTGQIVLTDLEGNVVPRPITADRVYADLSIGLAKKCYVDRLILEYKGKKYTDYHIRMKGVPNESILELCKSKKITPIELYEHLYDGKAARFDCLAGSQIRFENKPNRTVKTAVAVDKVIRISGEGCLPREDILNISERDYEVKLKTDL